MSCVCHPIDPARKALRAIMERQILKDRVVISYRSTKKPERRKHGTE